MISGSSALTTQRWSFAGKASRPKVSPIKRSIDIQGLIEENQEQSGLVAEEGEIGEPT